MFDHCYPSADFILHLMSNGIMFLMHASTGFYKEVVDTSTQDETVQIVITKDRAKAIRKQGHPVPKGTILEIRVLKIELHLGETEILVTDLTI